MAWGVPDLGAAAVGTPNWLTLANLLAVMGAVSPIILLIIGKRLSSRVDDATARKSDAEARKTDADAARQLIAEARQIMADKEALSEAKIEAVRTEAANEIEKMRLVAAQETGEAKLRLNRLEAEMVRLKRTLAVHIPWDIEAWSQLRMTNPNFPEPPALDALTNSEQLPEGK
jgi:uncharacterized membrane protein YhiD involved in acid resistance